MTPAAFRERLRGAWSLSTSSKWTAANPARGQCSVTAIAAQNLLGGAILRTQTSDGTHFYNRIDGVRYDFTASQFERPIAYDDAPATRDEALADTSPAQYAALKTALAK